MGTHWIRAQNKARTTPQELANGAHPLKKTMLHFKRKVSVNHIK